MLYQAHFQITRVICTQCRSPCWKAGRRPNHLSLLVDLINDLICTAFTLGDYLWLYKPVSDWLKMLPLDTTTLNM